MVYLVDLLRLIAHFLYLHIRCILTSSLRVTSLYYLVLNSLFLNLLLRHLLHDLILCSLFYYLLLDFLLFNYFRCLLCLDFDQCLLVLSQLQLTA